jgi:predicted  nucleic acid-binding Zn-ribbon protein
MRRYFKNLLSALLGNNPYEAERDELRRQMEQAGENVRGLNELYYNMVERWETEQKQMASLQQLVENLRERIADKDAVIKQYIIEVNALKGELQLEQKKEVPF